MKDDNLIQYARTVQVPSVCKPFPVLEANGIPVSLKQTQTYAGKTGYVLTNPDIVEARINVFDPSQTTEQNLQHPLWRDWHTTLTEEDKVGNNVLIFHGGYVFNKPERIQEAINNGLINGAGRLTEQEIKILKEAKRVVPDTQIPVIPYTEFSKLTQLQILQQLPRQYGISLTLEEATSLESGAHKLKQLETSPLFLTRAGGADKGKEYIEVLNQLGAKTYGNHHNFQENSGRLLYLNDFFDYGFDGNLRLDYVARFLGVSSAAESGAEKNSSPHLDERLKLLNKSGITNPSELKKAIELYQFAKKRF